MIEAASAALRFCNGRRREDLNTDDMLRFAMTRAVEIIGEAASKVSLETQSAIPQVPWPAIIGMRNRLVHAYFDVDSDILWTTVVDRFPALLADLQTVASTEGKLPGDDV